MHKTKNTMTEETIELQCSTNLEEYKKQVAEIIQLTEMLEEKLKRLNVTVTVTGISSEK